MRERSARKTPHRYSVPQSPPRGRVKLAPLALLVLVLFTSVTSYGRPSADPATLLEAARAHLTDLEREAALVRNDKLRNRLAKRIERVGALLNRADQVLEAPVGRPFEQVLAEVAAQDLDAERLEILRDAGRGGRYTAAQVRELAGTCTFDSTRVDALVALYPAVVDAAHFELALDVLGFPASREAVLAAVLADY